MKLNSVHISPTGFGRILSGINLASVLYAPSKHQEVINTLMRPMIQDLYEDQDSSALITMAGFPIVKSDTILEVSIDADKFIVYTIDRTTLKTVSQVYMSLYDFVRCYFTDPIMMATFEAPEHKYKSNLSAGDLYAEVTRIQKLFGRSPTTDQIWLADELLARWIGSSKFTQAPLILSILQDHVRIPGEMPDVDYRALILATPATKLQAIVQGLAMDSPPLCIRLNRYMLSKLDDAHLIAYKRYLTDRGIDVEKCGRLSKEGPPQKHNVELSTL